jgi:hypothetical protein
MKRVLFVLLWLGMCLFTQFGMSAEKTHTIDIRRDTFGFSSTSPSDYDWDEVLQGCSHRDCIPAIDQPKFIRADQASFLRGDELVIAIANDSEARAYPIRILVWHELVNDVFADIPIVVSYCPLCGSGLVFERTLDGEAVEFGVSGLLHNSDLIMYDRKSESLWQQITGTAFAGKKRGEQLPVYPSAMTTWDQWRSAHPNTLVLSTDTGHATYSYKETPYGDYATNDTLMFPVSIVDARRHPKLEIVGAEIDGQPVAYDLEYLRRAGTIEDEVADKKIRVKLGDDGMIVITQTDTKQSWPAHRMFWFAWYSFHPNTLLRDGE